MILISPIPDIAASERVRVAKPGANGAFAVRARVCLLRDLGAPLAPDNAWGIIQGLETAPLRMKQHCSNA